ncbi:hypothetical protein DW060_11045 [Leyella stercorea]|uniref:Uncharacterized protein n=1 Tax=Leyella stercorea TaxID=363265 RepID=A0A3R6FGV3_9BACT|nr:hypothetical protein DW060_11045 [Leyella stercorea]
MTGNTPTEITLPRYSPTEFTEFTEEVAESILPQISQIDTDRFFQGGALVSSAPTEQEVHQQSKKCNNRTVGALETSAPP